ncbi:MAG TPA: biopolymer transporter ExbD [Spirochaetota bacterium]|nr:biopolymer transporter ExbD [Spirochaetota bacterium]
MKITPKTKLFLSLESTAQTDIIMNLFIFFFISFSLLYTFNQNKQSDIKVNLPRGTTDMDQFKGPVVVSITKDNVIFFNSEKIELKNLTSNLSKNLERTMQDGLVIRSDKDASVDTLVKVLDTSKAAGINKLGIAIEVPKNPGEIQQ